MPHRAAAPADVAVAGPPVLVSNGPDPLPIGCYSAADQLNPPPERPHESSFVINPTNPNNLVMAWIPTGARAIVAASSLDGGQTWTNKVVPNLTDCTNSLPGLQSPFPFANDEWLSFGPDGTLYLVAELFPNICLPMQCLGDISPGWAVVSTSTDGRTWSAPTLVDGQIRPAVHNKSTVVADPNKPGKAYVAWFDAVTTFNTFVSVTTDGGRTWSAQPTPIPGAGVVPNQLLVLPDGRLLAVLSTIENPTALLATTSPTAFLNGVAWTPPATIALADPNHRLLASADVSKDGTIYVAWQTADQQNSTSSYVFSKSRDAVIWSQPAPVATTGGPPIPGGGPNSIMPPSVSVGEDGTVGVMFYDTRRGCSSVDVSPCNTDLWFRQSDDGGRTWSETHVAGPFDLSTALVQGPGNKPNLGDYVQGLAPTSEGFADAFLVAKPLATNTTDAFFSKITVGD